MTPQEFAETAALSPEAFARIKEMDRVLIEWSARHNLIARSTMDDRWSRHYLDSAQLLPLFPDEVRSIVDFGSGAGFPGLVLAAMMATRGTEVTLIESTGKKAAFLTAAAEAMGLTNLTVIPARIESVKLNLEPDIITARAVARLDKLLAYGDKIAGKSTRYYLLKGQDVDSELTQAAKSWHMDVIRHPSDTSPSGTILEIGNLTRA